MNKKIITQFPYTYQTIENTWIVLKDGTRLASRIWLPEVEKGQKVPAILEYIPYRKTDGTRTRDEPMHGYFAGQGYAVVRVDMRGSGESDGLLKDEYLKQEQDDALEVIEWIANQNWCDENIGMMGKSWGGFNSLQVAARRPQALKAIITVGFTDDRYNNDIHYKGGCLLNDNFWWGAIMLAYQLRPLDPHIVGESWREKWLERLENMPLWMAQWIKHQSRDEYWKHGSVCENYDEIEVPVLAIDGWEDAYSNTVLSLMKGLTVPRKGIIGPWAHVYPHDGVPGPAMGFLQEAVKWWDRWLKGIDNDVMDGPMVNVWVEESMPPSVSKTISKGHWVGLESWPSKEVKTKRYQLTYGKLLEGVNGKEEQVLLKTPLNHGLLSGEWMGAGVIGESPADQRLDDGMARVFESEVLETPLEIVGYPRFEVELMSDKSKAMLFAQLSDVAPDGAVTRVSYGVMNLTHLNGHDRVDLLTPGEKVKAFVDLDCCGHQFNEGHRIRLTLATTFWPMFWPMPEDATLTLNLETATFSLPIFNGNQITGPNMNPESAPLTPITILQEGRVDRSISYDILSDTWTCITDGVGGVFGEGIYRFDEIDVTVEHNLKRELTLSNSDPLSAKYTIYQKMKIGRDGWWIDANITITKTSDQENFRIVGDMDIKENDRYAFQKKWDQKIERFGL
ncbi:CocE/NonD family hydrolase [Lysinibacillus agricola]|uniref:CocE/NonD family hydrolase n=1 Tax=Lysinibacillus agricola TaxID=2590012 RepID=A0ABX7AW64_9BACI|nr:MULTISPECIES: CocE/NonD family hydrolase [Lysinibacillus]KOS63601.1 peptidase S15 [Lysinibacillus sp. FJAT-14222]QQP14069.1 CocE/NonD family hydrolase [Lysinibacillus agricola]